MSIPQITSMLASLPPQELIHALAAMPARLRALVSPADGAGMCKDAHCMLLQHIVRAVQAGEQDVNELNPRVRRLVQSEISTQEESGIDMHGSTLGDIERFIVGLPSTALKLRALRGLQPRLQDLLLRADSGCVALRQDSVLMAALGRSQPMRGSDAGSAEQEAAQRHSEETVPDSAATEEEMAPDSAATQEEMAPDSAATQEEVAQRHSEETVQEVALGHSEDMAGSSTATAEEVAGEGDRIAHDDVNIRESEAAQGGFPVLQEDSTAAEWSLREEQGAAADQHTLHSTLRSTVHTAEVAGSAEWSRAYQQGSALNNKDVEVDVLAFLAKYDTNDDQHLDVDECAQMLQHVNTHSSDRHLSHHTATVNTNRSVAVAPPAAPPQAAAQALLTLHKQQRESMQQQLSLIQGLLHGDYHSTVQTAQHSTGSRGRGPAPPSHGRRQSVEAPTPRAAPTHLTRPAPVSYTHLTLPTKRIV
eukprot:TRINITY_DN3892_c0_g1_i11.p1 TRINITY_DN3892_c0_g1~~TRINITY_DN3892_c0_g1_i11.p1  ORF type:complete len:476 (+),score=139.62 TRINITY_DN3892_c0_g1_i11:1299-2726(+)